MRETELSIIEWEWKREVQGVAQELQAPCTACTSRQSIMPGAGGAHADTPQQQTLQINASSLS